MNKNIGVSAGVLALLTVAFHLSSPQGENGAPKTENSAGAKPAKAQIKDETRPASEGPWLATQYFYGAADTTLLDKLEKKITTVENPQAILDCAADASCSDALRAAFAFPARSRAETLLATVADPLHTRLPLLTDSSIQAIELAASEAGWDFASQWLPWNDPVDPAEKNPADRAKQRALVRVQEKQPGLLVFRHKDDARTLLIFLVGETPTNGINRVQFRLARAYSRMVDPCPTVNILSPAFSGSFVSLADLVQADRDPQTPSTYRVRSGMAASLTAAEKFRGAALTGKGDEFQGEIENSPDHHHHFCQVLGRLGIPSEEAAVLVEEGTGFARGASGEKDCSTRLFHFPRDISHLRNVYRDAVAASQAGKGPAPDVDFSLKDAESGEDSVPTFSNAQTPVSQNAVLTSVMADIARLHIRLIDIQATSTLDTLFLARMLRRMAPDTRALVPFPDRLFAQAAQGEQLTGLLAISPYPLNFAATRWSGEDNLLTFPDISTEGEYNAAIFLLGANDKAADPGWTHHSWLLSLDRSGFVPVELLPTAFNPNWSEPGIPEQPLKHFVPDAPAIWVVLTTALAVLQLAVVSWALLLRFRPGLHGAAWLAPSLVSVWYPKARKFLPFVKDRARLLYLFTVLLILAGMQFLLLAPLSWKALKVLWLPCLLSVLGALASTALASAIARSQLTTPHYRTAVRALSLLFFAVLLSWDLLCHGPNLSHAALFSFRALELRAGSSPLLPLLASAAALLLFCASQIYRLFLAHNQQPKLFSWPDGMPLKARLDESYREFNVRSRALLGLPYNTGKRPMLLALLSSFAAFVLFFLLFHGWASIRSFDGRWFDGLSVTLQAAVLFALIHTGWQIAGLSRWLHLLLLSLQTLPISGAFAQLDICGGAKPIWVRRFKLQSFDVPVRGIVLLHDLALQADFAGAWVDQYRAVLVALLGPGKFKSRRMVRLRYGNLRNLKANIAGQIAPYLRLEWIERRLIQAACPPPAVAEEKEKNEPNAPSAYDLAQSFVALHYTSFLIYALRQIQNLLWFLSIGFLLLVVSLSCFSPQAPQTIGRFLLALAAVIGIVIWRCLAQFERDPILSRIAGTAAGELNTEFYVRLIAYGALPVLGILAAQFPSISNFLFSWVQPTLESMR